MGIESKGTPVDWDNLPICGTYIDFSPTLCVEPHPPAPEIPEGSVPEAGTLLLFSIGFAALALLRRR